MTYKDRVEAGQDLARELLLAGYSENAIVYGVPRGGVIVAAAVARGLGAPLGLVVARKIGHPMAPEFAIGAVTATGEVVWDASELGFTDLPWRESQVGQKRREARRMRVKYQGDQPALMATGKIAIIVDDGIATGLTAVAAVKELRHQNPALIVVAAPVASEDATRFVIEHADDLVIGFVPPGYFGSVANYYSEFEQVEDEEVRQALAAYRAGDGLLDLPGLNAVLATVRRFPVSVAELKARAIRLGAPRNVVQFFESIPADTAFESRAEVVRRSAQTELLMQEEAQAPEEHLQSYD